MELHFRVIVIDFSAGLPPVSTRSSLEKKMSVICVLMYFSSSLGKECFNKLFSLNVGLSG